MYAKYGGYQFDDGAVKIGERSRTRINAGGQPVSQINSFDVMGFLVGTSQSDMTTKILALRSALAINYQDFTLYTDVGGATATYLKNVGSITGVKVTRGPDFLENDGGEYINYRKFVFTVEAEYPFTGTGNFLLDFSESLAFSGGGPTYVHKCAVNGPPQKQLIYPATPYVLIQSGHAEGYTALPTVPQPLFPAALKQSADGGLGSPRRRGNGYEDFKISWRYTMEDAGPLIALPNIWR